MGDSVQTAPGFGGRRVTPLKPLAALILIAVMPKWLVFAFLASRTCQLGAVPLGRRHGGR